MSTEAVLHPVEILTVRMANDRPVRDFENSDVAFFPITRFNLRMAAGPGTKSTHLKGRHLVESPEYEAFWRHRIDIFERVCIPSVLNLSPLPHAWFIGFGEIDPPFLQEFLERLSLYPWIRPYFQKQDDPRSEPPVKQLLAEQMQVLGKRFVCATRLDSDDSLHQQFLGMLDVAIAQLRQRGMGNEKRSLNFPYGLVEADGALSVHLRSTSMFQSWFTPATMVEGPYSVPHDRVRERMPLAEILTNMPMWMYHRHDDVIDTPSAIPRDRLPLTDAERIFPLFGLTAGPRSGAATSGSAKRPAPKPERRGRAEKAAELRGARYWGAHQWGAASTLARSFDQPETAFWLLSGAGDFVDAAVVAREAEDRRHSVLNAPLLGRLGCLLRDSGEIVAALRIYEYAVELAPTDRHVRAFRDELAQSLISASDRVEQSRLAALGGPVGDRTNVAVMVTESAAELDSKGLLDALHERATHLVAQGYTVHVVQLPPQGDSSSESECAPNVVDQVHYVWLGATVPLPTGADASRQALVQRLGRYVVAQNPSLMLTDGSVVAQVVAAAVARAFGIPAQL